MKKWSLRITLVLTSLLLLLGGGFFYLTGTESGSSFLVNRIPGLLDGRLHIGASRGTLLNRLELRDILFRSPETGTTSINQLVLDWKSSDLFRLHLHILELTADTITYTPPPKAEPQAADSNETLTLPEIDLPFRITVEQLGIRTMSVLSATGEPAFLLNSADLALLWDHDIVLQNLKIAVPDAEISASGTIGPYGSYPMQLTTTVSSRGAELPALIIQGHYSGDINELTIQETVTGDIQAVLEGDIKNLLNEMTYTISLDINTLHPGQFSPDIQGNLSGLLESSGNLQQLAATASLNLQNDQNSALNSRADLEMAAQFDPMAITIRHLRIDQDNDSGASIDLSGSIHKNERMDLRLRWRKLRWPLSGTADYRSDQGQLSLSGTPDSYHLAIRDAVLAGSTLPDAVIQLDADGNRDGLTPLTLQTELLGGTATVTGSFQWNPLLSWHLKSTGKNINPGLHYQEWPGNLAWQLRSSGDMKEPGLTTGISIEKLQGSLRTLPVTGKGDIRIQADDIAISKFTLSSGNSNIFVNGTLGHSSRLKWSVDISEIADLYPEAAGLFHSSGTILGEMQNPRITLQLTGSGLAYQETTLDKIQAHADLDLSWKTPFTLNIRADRLKVGADSIDKVELNGSGTQNEHSIAIHAVLPPADISLGLTGGYRDELWQGSITELNLLSTELGPWKLQKTAKLSASRSSIDLSSTCLKQKESTLCAAVTWDGNTQCTSSTIHLDRLSLNLLSPWFPESLTTVSGALSAEASISVTDSINAAIQAEISPGNFAYLSSEKKGQLPHEGAQVNLHIQDGALESDFRISVDANRVTGKLTSPDILTGLKLNRAARLDGNIAIDAKEFDIIEVLVPAVQELNAAVAVNLGIKGKLDKPEIKGEGTIDIPHVFIPAAGLDLRDSSFTLLADTTAISFAGELKSPGGFLKLDGTAIPDAASKWPLQLSVTGNNFRLINLPEIRVFLSSDLLLKREKGLLSVTGEASIPKADILLRELPKGSQTSSPDVVIIQQQKTEGTSLPLRSDLTVHLGNKVHFAGFGLNAFISGQLHVLAEPDEQMTGSGAFYINQGSFRAYGQDLDIETGVISFPGGPLTQPGINLKATRNVGNIVAGINAIGPARKPRITTFSTPPMSESQVISYLLTGAGPGDAANGAKLSIGRQINNKLSVSVGTDVKTGDSEFVTRYRLNQKIYIQTTTAANGNAADIFYSFEAGGPEDTESLSGTAQKE